MDTSYLLQTETWLAFLEYNAKTAACLAIFYLLYKITLSRETFHAFNRIILLSSTLLSFLLPLCVITIYRQAPETATPLIAISDLSVAAIEEQLQQSLWRVAAILLFTMGVVVSLCYTCLSLFRIIGLIRRGEKEMIGENITLCIVDEDTTPFSWMRYVVISRSDYQASAREILTHELAHIRLHHSIDLLLTDLMSCLQWFNPAAWLVRQELRAVHEYEADQAVLNTGIDAQQYQLLLIKKAAGTRWSSIANSFNHSKLKNRITMMLCKKSSKWVQAKALYIVPIVAIALCAFAQTTTLYAENKGSNNIANSEPLYIANSGPLYVIDGVEMPKEEVSRLTADHIEQGTALKGETAIQKYGNKGADGVVEVSLNERSNVEKEVRVASNQPLGGATAQASASHKTPNNEEGEPFMVVEQMPEYPGGVSELMKFLSANIEYPADAVNEKIEGRVICQFVVAADGTVRDVVVLRSVSPSLDAEAVRVVSNMPKWKPGMHKGEAVRVKYTLPITFKLP